MANKTYKIPIVYQRMETFEVEAENLQDAIEKALKTFLVIPDEHYLEDSFEVDGIIEDNYPDEDFDMSKAMENI